MGRERGRVVEDVSTSSFAVTINPVHHQMTFRVTHDYWISPLVLSRERDVLGLVGLLILLKLDLRRRLALF